MPFAKDYGPNGTAVPINSEFVIMWNETMNWTSVEGAFNYSVAVVNGTVWTSANGTWAHNETALTSTFTPASLLSINTTYEVAVNVTATDLVGNQLDGNNDGFAEGWPDDVLSWNFTTYAAPSVVVSTVPNIGENGVDPNTVIVVEFSKPMNIASAHAGFSYTDAVTNWSIADGTVIWNSGVTEMTFTPAAALQNNTTYSVVLDGSLVFSQDGLKLDGNGDGLEGDDYAFWFKTWDEPPLPHVVHTNPPSGASNVPVNIVINLIFDAPMDQGSVAAAFSLTDGADVMDASDGSVQWFDGDTVFSFAPWLHLDHETEYNVTLDSSATSAYGMPLDGNNDGVAGLDDDYSFTFTTAPKPPTVTSSYPSDGAVDVPVELSQILLNFSKAMNTASVLIALSISPHLAYAPTWQGSEMNLTLNLNQSLANGTLYTISVFSSARDSDGNMIDGNGDGIGGDSYILRFTTFGAIEQIRPHIVGTYPGNNATGVFIDTFVAIEFSKVMNRTSVEEAFSLRNGSALVNGTFTWSFSGMSVKYTPHIPLEYNTTYYVQMLASARDQDGNNLTSGADWQFVTESAALSSFFDDNWWLIALVIFLIIVVIVQFLQTRGLKYRLRRTKVENKKLRKEMGIGPQRAPSPGTPAEAPSKGPSEEAESKPEAPVDDSNTGPADEAGKTSESSVVGADAGQGPGSPAEEPPNSA